ncbi:MAG TPA: histidine kinase [Chryseosolibacter sp.]
MQENRFPDIFSTKNIIVFWTILGGCAHLHEQWYLQKNGFTNDYKFTLIFASGWFVWGLLTPFMLWAIRRYPIVDARFGISLGRVVMLVMIFVVAHTVLEALLNVTLTYLFFKPLLSELLANLPTKLEASIIRRIFISAFVIAVVHSVDYFHKLKSKEIDELELQKRLAQAQLDALKLQLQPHFLFNTHHAIISLMMKNETEKAIDMLVALCDLLRLNLDTSGEHLVTLAREIDASNLYLSIQKVRFNNRLQVSYHIPEPLLQAQVPAFILQPLIENSIKHGIEKFRDSGRIDIAALREGSMLRIEITDDGAAIDKKSIRKGIGLGNSEARLQKLFKNDFKLELLAAWPRGTQLVMQIPLVIDNR